MADFDREAAQARRDEIRRSATRTATVNQLLLDADALDAALSVSEQQTAALRQDNGRLRRTVNESLSFLDNGMKHAATACLRAALSVQPKEGEK